MLSVLMTVKFIINNIIDNSRPCHNEEKIKYNLWFDRMVLPCNRDPNIPSGHSALGIYFGLLCCNPYLKLFLLLQPVFRYLSGKHSMVAVALGSMIGYLSYWIEINGYNV